MSQYEVNPNKEYILCGDISGSMQQLDPKCGGLSRYNYMLEKFELFIKTAEDYDEHGAATVLLFGEQVHVFEDIKLEQIKQKLQRVAFEGLTLTDKAIEKAFDLHLDRVDEFKKEGKVHPGTNLIVFTDGAATNRKEVARVLLDIADVIKSEDEFQVTFLTVGTIDRHLKDFLENLHDYLEENAENDFDIFHVDKLEDVNFLSAVSGALRHKE